MNTPLRSGLLLLAIVAAAPACSSTAEEPKASTSSASSYQRYRTLCGYPNVDTEDDAAIPCFCNDDQAACDWYDRNHVGLGPPPDPLSQAAVDFVRVLPNNVRIGEVQFALGVLNFVPGVNEVTIPVSLVLGTYVLILDSTRVVAGDGSLRSVGLDVATTAPVGGTIVGVLQVSVTGIATYRSY